MEKCDKVIFLNYNNLLKTIFRIDPSHSQSWTNLFVVLDHLSQCSQVIDLSYQALSSVPNESRVHMQIGSCHAKHSNFTAAENHIKSAIDLNPTSVLFHANLGTRFPGLNHKAVNVFKVFSTNE